ncbi:MAG TPA: hypothetical protein VK486_15585 [Thermoleophilaceae bacterium]|nr:hypothetical protein [Thermoleophilaceae bacterium]
MNRTFLALAAAAVVVAAAPAAAGAVGDDVSSARLTEGSSSTVATAARLRRPRGTYTGDHGRLQLNADGDSMPIFAFAFKCGSVTGRTALNDVAITRRRGRYRFSISAHGGITYSDDRSPDNGAIRLSGRFTPTAKRALGTFTVRTPRCGRTGPVEWSARRR